MPSLLAETPTTAMPDDQDRVTVLLGPLSCPFQYRVLSQTGTYVAEKLSLQVVEVDAAGDPEGYAARGSHPGILVKGRLLEHDLWQREKLDQELTGL